jgi:hypothetical protein
MRFLSGFISKAGRRTRLVRRRARLRTWARPLGDAGLSAESEAWVAEIEDSLRQAEPRIRADLGQRKNR